jgi:hypothetical protein
LECGILGRWIWKLWDTPYKWDFRDLKGYLSWGDVGFKGEYGGSHRISDEIQGDLVEEEEEEIPKMVMRVSSFHVFMILKLM